MILILTFYLCAQSWYEASLHLHSKLIMRADEYAATLQWNICRGTVASVTAVIEHGVPVTKYLRSMDATIHDPEFKLHLEPIPGIYQCAAACAWRLPLHDLEHMQVRHRLQYC